MLDTGNRRPSGNLSSYFFNIAKGVFSKGRLTAVEVFCLCNCNHNLPSNEVTTFSLVRFLTSTYDKPVKQERSIKAKEIGLGKMKRKSLYYSKFAMFCHIHQNASWSSIMRGFRYQVITCSDAA